MIWQEKEPGDFHLSCRYSENFEWYRWIDALPFLSFPDHWKVKIVPPFHGAVIRFKVKHRDYESEEVSVYFDGYNNLGHMYGPYWEIYPDKDGTTSRFMRGAEDAMLKSIDEALKKSP